MAKLYTIDNKLLTETPEIRIMDKIYPVDDRVKTVEKVQEIMDKDLNQGEMINKVLTLALGKTATKEIEEANYPFAGYMKILNAVVAAMLGEDAEEVEQRFQNAKSGKAEQM